MKFKIGIYVGLNSTYAITYFECEDNTVCSAEVVTDSVGDFLCGLNLEYEQWGTGVHDISGDLFFDENEDPFIENVSVSYSNPINDLEMLKILIQEGMREAESEHKSIVGRIDRSNALEMINLSLESQRVLGKHEAFSGLLKVLTSD